MSEKQIKKPTFISLIIGLFLFISLFSIPFIIEFTIGIGDSHSTFGESFGIAFGCFSFSIIAIIYIPTITWLSVGKNKDTERWRYLLCSLILGVIITGSGLAYSFANWQVNQDTRNEGEIVILNDRGFKLIYDFPGEGTENNPYMIENLQLNTSKQNSIYIRNTKKYFIIRNCTFNSTIHVKGAAFGTGKIIANNITLGSIWISFSDAIIIENNTVQSYIYVTNSQLAKIVCNTVKTLHISRSEQIIIDSNLGTKGLLISNSRLITVSNNIMYNYVFAGIHMLEVNNVLVVNNTCFNNKNGLSIEASEFVTVLGNNFSSNYEYGIFISAGTNITVASNSIQKNKNGLFFETQYNTTITRNLFGNNTEYGVFIKRSGLTNRIYQNNFYYNNLAGTISGFSQGFEDTNLTPLHFTTISWYNFDTNIGNYWSDLIWNEGVIYDIDGGNNTDPYPLENPVVF